MPWTSQQVKQFTSNSKRGTTIICWYWGAFRFHKGWSFATNVKSLQTTKLVVLQYIWDLVRMCLLQLMSWHARLGDTIWRQLHVLVTRRTWMWWDWKEIWPCKWHLVHSHIERLRVVVQYLASSHLEPLNFLHQCIIKSYNKTEVN